MDSTIQNQYYYQNGGGSIVPTSMYSGGPAFYATSSGPSHMEPPGLMSQQAYVLPVTQPQIMYYGAPAGGPGFYAPAQVYYQQAEASMAALNLGGTQQPPSTAGSTSSSSGDRQTQPLKSSTPLPAPEIASMGGATAINGAIMPLPHMLSHHYASTQLPMSQMPAYYTVAHPGGVQMGVPPGYEHLIHPAPASLHYEMSHNRMMSTDPDSVEPIEDISQISHQSSPDSYTNENLGAQQISGDQRILVQSTTPLVSRRRTIGGYYATPLIPLNYKTRMCTQWQSNRYCTMGDACKFAHGTAELRFPDRPLRAINNPKYKTKLCKNFEPEGNGQCAYAERCEYIHPGDREYSVYKTRLEQAAARYGRDGYRQQLRYAGRERGVAGDGASPGMEDERSGRSALSGAGDDSRDGYHVKKGYLGSQLPPSVTRSAARVSHHAHDRVSTHTESKRAAMGGSMYNLASCDDSTRAFRQRVQRAPSSTHLAARRAPVPARYTRRSSLSHLAAKEGKAWRSTDHLDRLPHQ